MEKVFAMAEEKMGNKGIIKVADKFFSDEELNQQRICLPP